MEVWEKQESSNVPFLLKTLLQRLISYQLQIFFPVARSINSLIFALHYWNASVNAYRVSSLHSWCMFSRRQVRGSQSRSNTFTSCPVRLLTVQHLFPWEGFFWSLAQIAKDWAIALPSHFCWVAHPQYRSGSQENSREPCRGRGAALPAAMFHAVTWELSDFLGGPHRNGLFELGLVNVKTSTFFELILLHFIAWP